MNLSQEKNKLPKQGAYFKKLVSKNGDLVVKDLGYKVNDPENKSKTNEVEDTNNEGNNVLGLKELKDSVNAANNRAKDNLDDDLNDLGESLVLSGKRRRCHFSVLLCLFCFATSLYHNTKQIAIEK